MKKVCETAHFNQKNENYPQCSDENAQKDAVASKVYLTLMRQPLLYYLISFIFSQHVTAIEPLPIWHETLSESGSILNSKSG